MMKQGMTKLNLNRGPTVIMSGAGGAKVAQKKPMEPIIDMDDSNKSEDDDIVGETVKASKGTTPALGFNR